MKTEVSSVYDSFLLLARELRSLTPPPGSHDMRLLTNEYASIAEQIHDAMSRMVNNPRTRVSSMMHTKISYASPTLLLQLCSSYVMLP